jgi:hypothetical protein
VLLDSTSSKDSNEILFVISGQVFYFLSILQDEIEIWKLKFKFENHLTGLTGGLTGLADVAQPYWPIPFR